MTESGHDQHDSTAAGDDLHALIEGNAVDGFKVRLFDGDDLLRWVERPVKPYDWSSLRKARRAARQAIRKERRRRRTELTDCEVIRA